jgi:hypothetical protein
LLRRAAEAALRGDLRRETPVLFGLDDGRLAEGVVDLAFRENAGRGAPGPPNHQTDSGPVWTVVDFKTDRELAGRRPEYEAQVALYAEAIARATDEPARGVLLTV